ncbi:hypothetical protein Osc1_07040 [Hominimerdicola sp. 21CYCFAH17_S]
MVERSCKAFLASSIISPDNGPKANAPIKAGKSDKPNRANDGDSGTGISANAKIKEIAESIAVITTALTFSARFFVFVSAFRFLLRDMN